MQELTAASYWRKNVQVLGVLLAVWFTVSYGLGILLVEPLNQFRMWGFPLGFWFAQQGAIYTFIGLILIYALVMDRLDAKLAASHAAASERTESIGHDEPGEDS